MGDLRLVAPALAAWGVTALLLSFPSLVGAWVTAAAVAAAVGGVVLGLRSRRPVVISMAVSLACSGIAMLATTSHITGLRGGPVADAAARHAVVHVTGVVTGDAKSVTSAFMSGWSARTRLHAVEIAGQEFDVDVPVSMQFTDPPPAPGTLIGTDVRLSPALESTDVAAFARVDGEVEVLEPPDALAAGATALRSGLWRALEGVDPGPASLVAGLSVGDESRTPTVLSSDMRASGLSHLTAVSGGNVAIVLGLVLLVGRFVRLRMRWRLTIAAVALVLFVVLVRPQPSVLRAAVMGSISLLALTQGSRSRGVPALAAAVLLLVWLAPGLALSLGFVLSVAATAGLLFIAPLIAKRWGVVLAVALAAQIATAPIIAARGSGLSLVSVPANILCAPVVPMVTVLGLGATLASPVAPPLAWLLAHAAVPPAWWIEQVATRAAALPLAVVPWPSGVLGALLVIAVTLAIVLVVRRVPRIRWPVWVALAAIALLVVCVRPPGSWPPDGWVIVACDVGQGDGLVVRTGERSAIVVDTGPDPMGITRCLRDLGVDEVPAVILTHFHVDHVGGLAGVLGEHPVGAIVVSPVRDPIDQAENVEREAADAGVPVVTATVGDVVQAGDLTWTVIWPARVIRDGSVPNNSSIVQLVDVHGVRALLTGDVEAAAQVALRDVLGSRQIDIVKVPHHGSRMIDTEFPGFVRPRVALISVGRDNDYGHPAPGTVAGWEAVGADVARTDLDGDVAVLADLTVVRRGVRE